MSDNNTALSIDDQRIHINSSMLSQALPKVYVEPCQTDFFYEKFKQSYPMFKNPRGLCLIVNIYQIDGMPPRRWSDRDTESLKQLFEQMLFTVKSYTDATHDLTCQSLKSIVRNFAQAPEHKEAQSCVVCLMSHGEEGYLTTKEGDKILLDELFTMFNNINCPNLAGKPKLFFIQSCRDDPISGPAEDLGIKLSFNLQDETNDKSDEADGNQIHSDTNLAFTMPPKRSLSESIPTESVAYSESTTAEPKLKQIICHIPTLCDVLVGYPTQKGYIAYRKPEVGSWYMNAIVQIFSKHACDTDVCALLNMVNSFISNEVTNTGKKQMSEYTSKLTKPYFYFFPGLASETTTTTTEAKQPVTNKKKKTLSYEENLNYFYPPANKKHRLDILIDNDTNSLIENLLTKSSSNFLSKYEGIPIGDQTDSNRITSSLKSKHLDFVAANANIHWKPIAREIKLLNECQILEIERSPKFLSMSQKLEFVLQIWLKKQQENRDANGRCFHLENLVKILQNCRLNKIKEELLMQCT